jgi:C_GCAxxG_C_C family probable redox protein
MQLDANFEQIIEKATRLGYENELNYFGCSQAVVSALIETFGVGNADVLRASTAMAGGIARRGTVCGALVGGLMFIGVLVGRDDMEILEQYERGQQYGDKDSEKEIRQIFQFVVGSGKKGFF